MTYLNWYRRQAVEGALTLVVGLTDSEAYLSSTQTTGSMTNQATPLVTTLQNDIELSSHNQCTVCTNFNIIDENHWYVHNEWITDNRFKLIKRTNSLKYQINKII